MIRKINAVLCAALPCLMAYSMLPSPARADTQTDWFVCENDYYDVDRAIAACTALIQSGALSGADLGEAFHKLGVNTYGKGQYAQAIQDFDQALALKPDNGTALAYRGKAYYQLGQYGRAIQDFDDAIPLEPDKSFSLYDRGLAKKKIGDVAGGDADIAAARQIDPNVSSDLIP